MSKKQKKAVDWTIGQAIYISNTTTNPDYLKRLSTYNWLPVRYNVLRNKHTPLGIIEEMQNDPDPKVAARARSIVFERKHSR